MKSKVLPEIAELNAERVINLILATHKLSREQLLNRTRQHSNHYIASVRAMAMALCRRGGMKQCRIAEMFGYSNTHVSKSIAAIDGRCVRYPDFARRMANAARDLGFARAA